MTGNRRAPSLRGGAVALVLGTAVLWLSSQGCAVLGAGEGARHRAEVEGIHRALAEGRVEEAVAACVFLLERDPGDPVARHLLILSLGRSTEPGHEAWRREVLEETAALEVGGPVARFARASARRELGDLEGARRDLDAILEDAGPSPQALGLRAWVRADEGDAEGALKDLDLALEGAPVSQAPGLRMQRALLRVETGDLEGGEEDLSLLVETHPDLPMPRLHLARLLAASERFEEALPHARRGADLAPKAAGAAALLAQILYMLGREEEARDVLEKAGPPR